MLVYTPTSWGELLDKITILEIKAERISDPAKLVNIHKELTALNHTVSTTAQLPATVPPLMAALKAVNEKLWVVEDDLREFERLKNFGDAFIQLARAVYFTNDERARLKREINQAMGSELSEEKSYAAY